MNWRAVFLVKDVPIKIMEFPILKTKKGISVSTQKNILEIQEFLKKNQKVNLTIFPVR